MSLPFDPRIIYTYLQKLYNNLSIFHYPAYYRSYKARLSIYYFTLVYKLICYFYGFPQYELHHLLITPYMDLLTAINTFYKTPTRQDAFTRPVLTSY